MLIESSREYYQKGSRTLYLVSIDICTVLVGFNWVALKQAARWSKFLQRAAVLQI